MKPKITIGIPFRNPGPHFELAIRSVFCQTFEDWELILLDDGSTDSSLALARSLKDPRVRVFSDGENKRVNLRLNEISTIARAPYIVRMDADDIMHPERLERQYAELARHDSNTVIGTGAYEIDDNSNLIGVRKPARGRSGFSVHQSFVHPSVAAATEWFRRNPYSESFVFHRAQDAELWCRTKSHSNFVNLPDLLLYYREANLFRYDKYIGTQMGLICLLRLEFSRPQTRYLGNLLKCVAKIYAVSALDALGHASVIVGRRHRPLAPEQRPHAEDGLARVLSCPLPI